MAQIVMHTRRPGVPGNNLRVEALQSKTDFPPLVGISILRELPLHYSPRPPFGQKDVHRIPSIPTSPHSLPALSFDVNPN